MQRPTVVLIVLAGITLSGALGGHVMRQQPPAPQPRIVAARTTHPLVILQVANAACPTVSRHEDASCDTLTGSGN